jgi:hypothetical protein
MTRLHQAAVHLRDCKSIVDEILEQISSEIDGEDDTWMLALLAEAHAKLNLAWLDRDGCVSLEDNDYSNARSTVCDGPNFEFVLRTFREASEAGQGWA